MIEAIKYYLESDKTIEEVAKIYNLDRKRLSKEISKLYPNSKITKFINICNLVHKNKYDYSTVNFNRVKDKVSIKCPTHGLFTQEAYSHKRGLGCNKCSYAIIAQNKKDTIEKFIEKAQKVHGDFYNYDNVQLVDNRTKISISCKYHGDFKQTPDDHKSGKGCIKCARENIGWTKTQWKNKGKNRIAKVYIIRCWNNEEQFIKIGRTFNSVKRRFGSRYEMPYQWEIIRTFESLDYDFIWSKEVELHRLYKVHKYIPNIHFEGNTECFQIDILDKLTGTD